ncbi:MAG: hypothetical protein ACI959_000591 [Limisphaerales bacterium]|jgi:hypothetical protein
MKKYIPQLILPVLLLAHLSFKFCFLGAFQFEASSTIENPIISTEVAYPSEAIFDEQSGTLSILAIPVNYTEKTYTEELDK